MRNLSIIVVVTVLVLYKQSQSVAFGAGAQAPTPAVGTLCLESPSKTNSQPAASAPETTNPGTQEAADRIIRGSQVGKSEYSFVVAILREKDGQYKLLCSGTLIERNRALTAAHCNIQQGDVVRAGSTDLGAQEGRDLTVEAVCTNPAYIPGQMQSDLAFLVLSGETIPRPTVVKLAKSSHKGKATVVGWGRSRREDPNSVGLLMKAKLPLVTPSADNLLHAGGTGSDICFGDSGGGLFHGGRKQIGISVYGFGCTGTQPALFVPIASHRPWIDDVLTLFAADKH